MQIFQGVYLTVIIFMRNKPYIIKRIELEELGLKGVLLIYAQQRNVPKRHGRKLQNKIKNHGIRFQERERNTK